MGLFDFLPCCGRRQDKDNAPDTEPLLAPRSAESITSQEGYGAMGMGIPPPELPTNSLSTSARARIDAIGRVAGNHMLPINQASRAATTSPHQRQPSASGRPPSPDSTSSPSRPPTPSPRRAAPPGGVLSPPLTDGDEAMGSGAATPSTVAGDGDDVVHKSVFNGAAGGGKRGGKSGRGGRGRGRGRSKKHK